MSSRAVAHFKRPAKRNTLNQDLASAAPGLKCSTNQMQSRSQYSAGLDSTLHMPQSTKSKGHSNPRSISNESQRQSYFSSTKPAPFQARYDNKAAMSKVTPKFPMQAAPSFHGPRFTADPKPEIRPNIAVTVRRKFLVD